jgi:hypothetical protein
VPAVWEESLLASAPQFSDTPVAWPLALLAGLVLPNEAVCPAAWVTEKVLSAIVLLPVRCDDALFAVHDTVTVPDPLPAVGVIESHDVVLDVVQLPPVQPEGTPVTVTDCDPEVADGDADWGLMLNEVQLGGADAPACVTVKRCSPMFTFPVREDETVLVVHVTVVVDDAPPPVTGDTLSQSASLPANHWPPLHPCGNPMTVTTCDDAVADGLALPGLSANAVQVVAPAACVTVTLLPFVNVTVPPLDELLVLVCHDTLAVLEAPLPLLGDTLNHDPVVDADHEPPLQPDGLPVMVTDCDPAADVGDMVVGLTEKLEQVTGAALTVTVCS